MASTDYYDEEDWATSAGHYPLRDRPADDLMLLHRHWMWANQQREAFDRCLQEGSDEPLDLGSAMLASRHLGFMFAWYSMLWAVIEACIDRKIDIRGKFRKDIDELTPLLRRCRNAVFHVSRAGGYFDNRMLHLVSEGSSAAILRRISGGFGRLFLEECARRRGEAQLFS